jgi:ribonuclease PH
MLVISKRIKPFLGIRTIWIKIDNLGFFFDVLVVLAVLPALIALIVFVAPTVFVVVAIAAAVVAVVVEEVVVAADNSSFQIKNIVIYGEKPLHKVQGLFSKRLDIRDKLQYIGL